MLYLDTSALLKLYILEDGSERVQELIASQDHPLPIWEIQEMELVNALRLKVFWQEISREQAESQIDLYHERKRRGLYFFPEVRRGELLAGFLKLGEETHRIGCRTLDILHVACAAQLGVSQFVTFDDRQRQLARHAGLNV